MFCPGSLSQSSTGHCRGPSFEQSKVNSEPEEEEGGLEGEDVDDGCRGA